MRDILPYEAELTRYIRRNWRNASDVADLRQGVYARICASAREALPLQAHAFLFAVARNHLITSAKQARVVSFEHVADLEASAVLADTVTPDRVLSAREELRRVQLGLDGLPPRCREVVMLRKIEGLSTGQVAARLNIATNTVENHLVYGMRALVDYMLGGSGKIRRPAPARKNAERSVQ